MPGILRLQPRPKGPLPVPVLYKRVRSGCRPPRPGGTAIGTEKLPVPVKRSGENFSPTPDSAPPPFGNEIAGMPLAELDIHRTLLGLQIGTFVLERPVFWRLHECICYGRYQDPNLGRRGAALDRCARASNSMTGLETSLAPA
jgi:hypothetical protein